MSDQLFDVPETLSPRLAWMKREGVITYHLSNFEDEATWLAGFQEWWPDLKGGDFFAHETAHNGDSRVTEAQTEHEAIADLAKRYGLKLWNEEEA